MITVGVELTMYQSTHPDNSSNPIFWISIDSVLQVLGESTLSDLGGTSHSSKQINHSSFKERMACTLPSSYSFLITFSLISRK